MTMLPDRMRPGAADAVRRAGRTIFEYDTPGAECAGCPSLDVPEGDLGQWLGGRERTSDPGVPHLAEVTIARHYARLASMNFGVDSGSYPLGSCTMKYNPRICEDAVRIPELAGLHPYQPVGTAQGALGLMWELQKALAEIAGLPAVTLQPAAGAHGELTALMVIRAAHEAAGDVRRRVIIPDTAHGTNPATVTMCGYETTTVPSAPDGGVDIEAFEAAMGPDVAAVMLTNPNTLGLFDKNITRITEITHAAGALAYCDGANMNAILGKARPGDMGFDALHFNLHKTFGTPHGGGGPGSGPVAVSERLAPYLPGPVVGRVEDGFDWESPARSIGRVRAFAGNFGVLIRAYAYILAVGGEGLREVSEQAVLSANYVMGKLSDAWELPFDGPCMHEFVLSGEDLKRRTGVRTLDVAKRLLDYGFHPPTVYFPLLVPEAMMIEPTETETLEELDAFVAAMLSIAKEAEDDPEMVKSAPHTTPVRRLDEATAAREPDLADRG